MLVTGKMKQVVPCSRIPAQVSDPCQVQGTLRSQRFDLTSETVLGEEKQEL